MTMASRLALGLPDVEVALGSEQEALGGQPEADVEHDESTHDEAVAPDAATRDLVVQQCPGVVFEAGVAGGEAPQKHVPHPDQHQHREQIGGESVEVAQQAKVEPHEPARRQVPLECVEQIDQQIEGEPEEDEAVEQADPGSVAKHRPLRDGAPDGFAGSEHKAIEAAEGVGLAASDHIDHALEADVGEVADNGSKDKEDDLFGRGQQASFLQTRRPGRDRESCHHGTAMCPVPVALSRVYAVAGCQGQRLHRSCAAPIEAPDGRVSNIIP